MSVSAHITRQNKKFIIGFKLIKYPYILCTIIYMLAYILYFTLESKKIIVGLLIITSRYVFNIQGGGPRVVVSTAAFHARVRGSVPGHSGLKETNMFLPHPRVKLSIVGSLRDREVACSASDRQGSNFESCV